MESENKPLSRREEVVVEETDDEVLIYDLRKDKTFRLNKVSSLIWTLSDGSKTVPEITAAVSEKLNSPVDEKLVGTALEHLKKADLILGSQEAGLRLPEL